MTRPPEPSRRTGVLALAAYAAFLVYQSLAGGGAWSCGDAVLVASARPSRADLLANMVAYLPLGVLVVHAATRGAAARGPRLAMRIAGGVLLIAALSLAMELLQVCLAARVSSAYDVVANTIGGVVGAAIALGSRSLSGNLRTRGNAGVTLVDPRLRGLTVGVAAVWVAAQAAPWVFSLDVGTVRANLSFLRHWSDAPPLDAWRVVRHAGAWLAVACACRLVAADRRVAVASVLGVGAVSIILQVLIDAQAPLSVEELGGMAIGVASALPLLGVSGRAPRGRRWAMAMACGALLSVAAYELRPDPIGAAARAFSWWPLVGLGGPLGALDYALLFGWFGFTAVVAAQWAGRDGVAHAPRSWPAVAVLTTLVFELLQTRIAGRGPDVSAPLFTLLAVLATTACLPAADDGAA